MKLAASIAALAAVAATPGTADASPTTAGVEAELVHHYIDLSDVTALRAWGNPTYVDEPTREIGQRIVCTVERSKIDPDFPLVSLTFDMWTSAYANNHLRRLEIVTGPVIGADAGAWTAVRDNVQGVYRMFAAACKPASYDHKVKATVTSRPHCAVTVGALLAASEGLLTTKCHAEAARDFRIELADKVRIAARLDEQGKLPVRSGFEGAGVQVSLAIDLEDFARLDLSKLFEGGTAANLAYKLLRQDKDWKGLAARGFTAEQAGFIAVQHASFHAYLKYFHDKFKKLNGNLWSLIAGHTITDEDDYKMKSDFTLFPKAGLEVLYRRLADGDPQFAGRLQALRGDWACGHELVFKKFLSPDIDEDRQDECADVFERTWLPAITSGRDPLGLQQIANPIAPRLSDGKLRAVFELRGRNDHPMRTSRVLRVKVDEPADKIELAWDADFVVAEGLP